MHKPETTIKQQTKPKLTNMLFDKILVINKLINSPQTGLAWKQANLSRKDHLDQHLEAVNQMQN